MKGRGYFLAAVLLVLCLSVPAQAAYTVKRLTFDFYGDMNPRINNLGQVVWYELRWPEAIAQVFFYNGVRTIRLTNNDYNVNPDINDNGWVVWQGAVNNRYGQIFLYNGTETIQLTDDSQEDIEPKISNNGYIYWRKGDRGGPFRLYRYNGELIEQVTSWGSARNHQVNDQGWVVFDRSDGNDYEIFLFKGTQVERITNNAYDDLYPQINNSGQIVWQGWAGNDFEIFLFDGTEIVQLTDNDYDDKAPQINDNGWVTWWAGGTPPHRHFTVASNNSVEMKRGEGETGRNGCRKSLSPWTRDGSPPSMEIG